MLSLDGVNSAGLAWSECLVSNEATPFELAERHFLNDKITQAMERLPQKEQQVLTGIYLEDKSAGDLAASIDVTWGTFIGCRNKVYAELEVCFHD